MGTLTTLYIDQILILIPIERCTGHTTGRYMGTARLGA